jgi:hypothetical protein
MSFWHYGAGMPDAVLRATDEAGQTYDDPSDGLLFDLIRGLDGDNTFVIVERLRDPTGNSYAQTMRSMTDGTYLVEYQDGSLDNHFSCDGVDGPTAHAVISGWAFEVPGWRDRVSWSRVEL